MSETPRQGGGGGGGGGTKALVISSYLTLMLFRVFLYFYNFLQYAPVLVIFLFTLKVKKSKGVAARKVMLFSAHAYYVNGCDMCIYVLVSVCVCVCVCVCVRACL